jgi:hypothetical protein
MNLIVNHARQQVQTDCLNNLIGPRMHRRINRGNP